MILIFSIRSEYATSQVVKLLVQNGEQVVRINGDDDRFKLHHIDTTGVYASDRLNDTVINLCEAKSYWFRRSGITRAFIGMDSSKIIGKEIFYGASDDIFLKNYLTNEGDALMDFIYSRIEAAAPRKLGSYFNKSCNRLVLLETAAMFGFKIPKYTVITNESQVGTLHKHDANVVTKSISDGIYQNNGNRRFYTYTERLTEADLLIEEPIEIFPTLVMEEIEKSFEIRAFYLNGFFYSMAIFSQADKQTQIDFRKYNQTKPNRTEPFSLPKSVEKKLRNVFQHLQLNTGSADIIVDKNGEYVFLEINPVGQFGMTSAPCNYFLEQKIANYLSYERA